MDLRSGIGGRGRGEQSCGHEVWDGREGQGRAIKWT